jgi:molybdopterin synthase sulfur carrier subunit
MKIYLLLFGVAKEILGGDKLVIEFEGNTAGELKTFLCEKYPRLAGLKSFAVAINHHYANDEVIISEKDEIAVIPPVSGG